MAGMEFTSILAACLSSDKATREAGEKTLTMWLDQNPDEIALMLARNMSQSDDNLSGVSTVLFRRLVLESKLYERLALDTKTQVWSSTLQLPSAQRSLLYLKRVGDVLVNLANSGHNIGELLNCMATWAQSAEESARVLAMYMFELCSDFEVIKNVLRSHCETVLTILTKAMQDLCPTVSLAAVKSLAAFLSGFDQENQVLPYSPDLGLSLDIVSAVLNSPSPPFDAVIKALNSLAELTEVFPRVWKASLEVLVNLMCAIARKSDLEELRSAAVEVLATFISRAPGMLKKHPLIVQEILSTALILASEVDHKDDIGAWNTDEEETEVVMNDPYSLGKDLLSRAANSFGSEVVLPVLFHLIPLHLQSEDWTRQHTGILAIGMIAEGCHSQFEASMSQVLAMFLPFMQSPNPRLKWAALTTLGLFCSEFEPIVQLNFHSQVMPSILACMTESDMLRVSTQAAACLVNYSRGLNDDVDISSALGQYTSPLLGALGNLLNIGINKSSYPLLEEVLNSLSMTAAALSKSFEPFYYDFMPGLMNLARTPVTTALQKQVQAHSIRTMGHIVDSVAESGDYLEDANSVFCSLLRLKATLSLDSPAFLAIYEVMGHFAACLKHRFTGYLQSILPDLMQFASQQVQITFHDADSAEAMELGPNMNALRFEFRGLGEKQLAINTLELEMKIKAVRILYDVVSELQKDFSPFVETTVAALTPLFCYVYSNDIRKYSIMTVTACAACTQPAQGTALLRSLHPVFRDALVFSAKKLAPVDVKRLLTGLLQCFEAVEGAAIEDFGAACEISGVLADVVRKVFDRKATRLTAMKELEDTELYSEDLEQIKEAEGTDDKILIKVMEHVGKLLKTFKGKFQQPFTEHFQPLYAALFNKPQPSNQETLAAICLFDDYVEFTGDLLFCEGRSPVIDQMLKYAGHASPDLRQSASYGLGVCAEKASPAAFAPYLRAAYEALSAVVRAPNARSNKYKVSTDCAIGAIGKLAVFQLTSLIPEWLSLLPISAECEEAQAVHRNFLQHVAVISPKDPAVVRVLTDLLGLIRTDSEMVAGEDVQLIQQLVV
jgi:hypothetical protein